MRRPGALTVPTEESGSALNALALNGSAMRAGGQRVWERTFMRPSKHRRGGGPPPSIDPAFADALAGEAGKRSRSGSESRSQQKHHYKALQLSRQVQRVISLALWEVGDEMLR